MDDPQLIGSLSASDAAVLHRNVSKALAIAKGLSGRSGGDRQDRYAADAIVDYLSAAPRLLESKEAPPSFGNPPPAY